MRTSDFPVQVRLTKAEHAHFIEQVEMSGMSISLFLRKLIEGVQMKPRVPEPYYEVQGLAATITNDVKDIARIARASHSVDIEQIKALQTMVDKLYEAVMDLR